MQTFIFILLCGIWGTTWMAIKFSLDGLPPFLGAGLRFSIAVILLFLFARWKGISLKIDRIHFRYILLSAFFMYVLDYGFIYWGEQYLTAGVTAIFFATFPIFTGIWATFLFRSEKFRLNKFLGLLLGFAGIFIVFYDQLLQTRFDTAIILGTAAVVLGAAGGAMAVVIVKKYLDAVNSVTLSFYQMLTGVLFLVSIGLITENPETIRMTPRVWAAVIYLGGVGSAFAFALYYWLLKQVSAITLSLIIYVTPIIATMVDFLVFGEIIHLRTLGGMAVIFFRNRPDAIGNVPVEIPAAKNSVRRPAETKVSFQIIF